jgi:hypothetical protein
MPEQELNGPQVSRAPIDQGCLGSPERMCAEEMWVKADAGEPF